MYLYIVANTVVITALLLLLCVGAKDWRRSGGARIHGTGRHETSLEQPSVYLWWVWFCQRWQCVQGKKYVCMGMYNYGTLPILNSCQNVQPQLISWWLISHSLTLSLQVCDEPHPLLIKEMLSHCVEGNIEKSYQILKSLWDKGYSPHDIITNIFRVCRNHPMAEYIKLEYIKVTPAMIDIPLCTFLYKKNTYQGSHYRVVEWRCTAPFCLM